jgi:hypothetical protein
MGAALLPSHRHLRVEWLADGAPSKRQRLSIGNPSGLLTFITMTALLGSHVAITRGLPRLADWR